MWRIWLAIRVFFLALFQRDVAERVRLALEGPAASPRLSPPQGAAPGKPTAKPEPVAKALQRSDALTLLAALQREARFIDFIEEPLDDYSDAQVGAAVRDVHRNCRTILQRMFELKPLLGDAEGAEIEVEAGFDPGRYRLVGKVAGEPPFRGRLTHPGWEAAKCEVPTWSGEKSAVRIVAAAEVEL